MTTAFLRSRYLEPWRLSSEGPRDQPQPFGSVRGNASLRQREKYMSPSNVENTMNHDNASYDVSTSFLQRGAEELAVEVQVIP